MTREEAIRCLSVHSSTNGSGLCTDEQHYEAKQVAIQALEQEPCEDAISRQAVHEAITRWAGSMSVLIALPTREVRPLFDSMHDLPPVIPKPHLSDTNDGNMSESDHKCHNCKHYTSGERDGSCGSYICKHYSGWESEG